MGSYYEVHRQAPVAVAHGEIGTDILTANAMIVEGSALCVRGGATPAALTLEQLPPLRSARTVPESSAVRWRATKLPLSSISTGIARAANAVADGPLNGSLLGFQLPSLHCPRLLRQLD